MNTCAMRPGSRVRVSPRRRLALCLAFAFLFALFGAGTASAQDVAKRAPEQAPKRVQRVKIQFAKDLFVDQDIMLRGTHAEARVTFTRPASWKILPESKLHIFYTNSGTLLPEQSSLTVRIADLSRSVRLEVDGNPDALNELVVPIDPSLLGPYNSINFVAGLHYTLECEDPFHPNLWASISKNSYIEFVYEEEDAFTDLAVFPFPYFDPLAYPPVDLTYVLPTNPSSQTLSALARVSGSIAQDAAYRPLAVKFTDSLPATPTGNYVLIGTAAEQPDAARLLAAHGIAMPGSGQGLLSSVQIPADRRFAAMIVTGNSGAGVLQAASALVDRGTRAALVGNSSVVASYESSAVAELRDWEGFAPDRTNFTLQDLGFGGQTVRGVFSAPVRVDVKVQPDSRPVEYRQRLNIHYAYSALLKPELSTLEVILNGISLHSVPLSNPEGSESEWLSLDVPWDIYGPFNRLELHFHMFPDTMRECERVSDRQLWGTIFPDSNFVMPRDYWTEYPDIATFARWGYPFTLRADLSDTVFVLSGPQDAGAMRSLVRLSNFFMKPHPREAVRAHVVYSDELDESLLVGHHLVFLSPNGNGAASQLVADAAMIFRPDGTVDLQGARAAGLTSYAYEDGAILEVMVSPWNGQRAVLLAHDSDDGNLSQLFDKDAPDVLGKMRGAASVISTGGEVNSVPPASTSILGQIPLNRRVRYLLAAYWGVFLVIGLLAILLLFAAFRMVLDRRRRRIEDERD